MANTGNLLDKIPEGKLETATGSKFILNNTSYSGADIKVVVHMYDSSSATEQQTNLITDELLKAEATLTRIRSNISRLRAFLSSAKPSTPEAQTSSNRLNFLIVEQVEVQLAIQGLQNRLASLSKNAPVVGTKVLAEVQTLAVSTYRDKQAVRSLGSVYPKSFTRGPREIGGTLVFTVFDEHVLYQFLGSNIADFDHSSGLTAALLDQLPPVDITVAFANEFGSVSRLAITGVEFVDEGQTMSVEDLITENVVSFVARDIDPMRSVKQRQLDEESRLVQSFAAKRASDLILEEDYKKIKDTISPFARFRRRRNPYQ